MKCREGRAEGRRRLSWAQDENCPCPFYPAAVEERHRPSPPACHHAGHGAPGLSQRPSRRRAARVGAPAAAPGARPGAGLRGLPPRPRDSGSPGAAPRPPPPLPDTNAAALARSARDSLGNAARATTALLRGPRQELTAPRPRDEASPRDEPANRRARPPVTAAALPRG